MNAKITQNLIVLIDGVEHEFVVDFNPCDLCSVGDDECEGNVGKVCRSLNNLSAEVGVQFGPKVVEKPVIDLTVQKEINYRLVLNKTKEVTCDLCSFNRCCKKEYSDKCGDEYYFIEI